jgi:hypothetical protein
MKNPFLGAIAVLLLTGCVGGAQVPDAGTPFIQTYSGNGGFGGFVQKTVYADDTIVIESSGEGGRDQRTAVVAGYPGVFVAVRDIVQAQGPVVRVDAPGQDHLCLDYGEDRVTAQPAVGRFTQISASCPEPAMQAFYRRVFDAMAAP